MIDTSAGVYFDYTWTGCTSLTGFPHLDTSNGTGFNGTWYDCSGLTTFPTLDLHNLTDGTNLFGPGGISAGSYSALLIHLAENNTNTGVNLWVGFTSRYQSDASQARNEILIGSRGWIIFDGGMEPPTITSARMRTALIGSSFSYQIIASNAPDHFDATPLPAGLTIDEATGIISGTVPSVIGTHTIALQAANAGGPGLATLTLYVNEAKAPVITSRTSVGAVAGRPFRYQITATNHPWYFGASDLPSDLSFNAETGLITGRPHAGTAILSLTASNDHGTDAVELTITTVTGADDEHGHRCGAGSGISSLLLLGFGLAGLQFIRPRKQKATSAA
jgi:hypothetical protein